MSNIVPKAEGALAAPISRDELIATLRDSHYPGAKIESVAAVLGYCKAADLDPMDKPVHIVPMQVPTGRKDSDGWDITESRDVVMPGIGLYRTKAQRTGQYAGQSEPEFGPDVVEALDGVQITFPAWCRVTVYRLLPGLSAPVAYSAIERWKENYATKSRKSSAPNAMWKKRPYGQLAKCAEAQALRKGFPDAVGSAPTADEMEGKSLDADQIDADTGVVRGAPLMPQRKSATDSSPPMSTNGEAQDVAFKDKPNAPAATQAACINAGQVKYLENKIASIDLDAEAVKQLLSRHGIAALDTTITVDKFDALKAELLAMA